MVGLISGDVVQLHDGRTVAIEDGYWARKRFMGAVHHFDYQGTYLAGETVYFDAAEIAHVVSSRAEVHAGPRTL